MKTKKEILEILKDCADSAEDYKLSEEGGDLINQGWVEALCFVLGIEVCGCQIRPVEKGYQHCSVCLDEQDDEIRRHNEG